MYMYMLQVAADSAPLARVGEREREGATPLPPPPPPSLSSRAESKESFGACWQAAMGGCAATIAVQTAATTIPSSIIMIIINAALQSARLLDKMDTRNIGTPRPWPSLPPHRLPLSLRSAERCSAAWGSLRHLEPRAAFPAALQRPAAAAASRPTAFGGGRRREGSPRTCTEQGEWERERERDRRRRATR